MKQISKFILWLAGVQVITAASISHENYTFKSIKVLRESIFKQSQYEQFTLGKVEDGAQIVYMDQSNQTFDDKQSEISLDINYPLEDSYDIDETQKLPVITQIQLFVKTETDAHTQSYILGGGIGENNIRLRIVSNNSCLLNCMIVIYGKKRDELES